MRATFQEQLEELERSLQAQGDLAMRDLRSALEALGTSDEGLAGEVIRSDAESRERFSAIEEMVQVLLARQAPVATDLRLVLSALHVNVALERIVAYASTIAKLTRLVADKPTDQHVQELLETMGLRTEQMIRVALDSLAARDADRARSLDELDQLVDETNRLVVHTVLELAEDSEVRAWALQMLIVARSLERIGDHAVDIGEQVIFLVTGELRALDSSE